MLFPKMVPEKCGNFDQKIKFHLKSACISKTTQCIFSEIPFPLNRSWGLLVGLLPPLLQTANTEQSSTVTYKLFTSDGYQFGVKKTNKTSRNWRCTQRAQNCLATIIEKLGTYKKDKTAHNDAGTPGLFQKIDFKMSMLQSSEKEKHETARNIVENQITAQNFTDGTFIPNPESAIRLVNRHKAKKCPRDPTLECKIRLSCIDIEDSYLIADCKIEDNGEIVARHLIFATQTFSEKFFASVQPFT